MTKTPMHKHQINLLKLIDDKKDLSGKTLRDVGNMVGIGSAQKTKHHLEQLRKRGAIVFCPSVQVIKHIPKHPHVGKEGLVSIPIGSNRINRGFKYELI